MIGGELLGCIDRYKEERFDRVEEDILNYFFGFVEWILRKNE